MNTPKHIAITLVALALQSLAFAQPILIPPTNQTVCLNAPAIFRVRVSSGTSPYTYAWQHDGVPMDPNANATAATAQLTISNAALSDAGQYRVFNDATALTAFWTDATLVDHNRDGWLDLFATSQRVPPAGPFDNFFLENLTDGRFAAWTTNEVGAVLKPQGSAAGPAWCDLVTGMATSIFMFPDTWRPRIFCTATMVAV